MVILPVCLKIVNWTSNYMFGIQFCVYVVALGGSCCSCCILQSIYNIVFPLDLVYQYHFSDLDLYRIRMIFHLMLYVYHVD